MGLERTASVMQGVLSNFEIDILKPLCIAAGEVVGAKYEYAGKTGRPMRRIADHLRACAFAIHEGVAPGSNGAEYIIRLLLRRALLEGYLLGKQEPFLHKLVPTVIELMKGPYPELIETEKSVVNTIRDEEATFLGTIDRGWPSSISWSRRSRRTAAPSCRVKLCSTCIRRTGLCTTCRWLWLRIAA